MIGISSDFDLVDDYLAECRDRLASIGKDLLTVEYAGVEFNERLLDRVILALRSTEAGAALFDLGKIGEVARPMEEVLWLIRSGEMAPSRARIGVLISATDQLYEMIQSREAVGRADIASVLAGLSTLLPKHPAGSAAARANSGEGNLRILLVEDDFASRLLLQTFLGHYGKCEIAVNGREAVDAFRSSLEKGERYDLICMDIMMPEMDGREAVRQIRALEESVGIHSTSGAKIVMTTTISDIGEVSRCFSDLCDGYLVKPIDLAKLLNQMKAYHLVR
jgi:two-component system chemotaxis response regulator CheY